MGTINGNGNKVILKTVIGILIAGVLGFIGTKSVTSQNHDQVKETVSDGIDKHPTIKKISGDITDIRIQQAVDSGKLDLLLDRQNDNND